MSHVSISVAEFQAALPSICTKETSADTAGWTKENPLYAHCAVVALIAQDLFGGGLRRASLEPYPEFAHMRSHYWNRLPSGEEIDFTAPQFFGRRPALVGESRGRKSLLEHVSTSSRYRALALRLAKFRFGNNPLFDDPIYQQCFHAALDSSCEKMKFGCVITHNGGVVYAGANKTIPRLCAMCDPYCMRLDIMSRTESMLGACGHAEEWGLWAVPRSIPLVECELYIAGFYPDGFPWIKKRAEHTCLRCAVQMWHAHIGKIHVPVKDRWKSLTADEALETARQYATKEKTV